MTATGTFDYAYFFKTIGNQKHFHKAFFKNSIICAGPGRVQMQKSTQKPRRLTQEKRPVSVLVAFFCVAGMRRIADIGLFTFPSYLKI
ncbi:hypothetical protein HNR65_002537 [Desulfosalsimonas propionicica]|uniref:Uncharacterized protein n=1 Tax=Desulfosalsimonas propionicica TaxID=332175 RepID=A0A7W0CAJ3_9BACT|nr:hypothetical protein [Desulfosalsimonas propionicica]MBA2882196.1 hypothetical protein [Desulfosalsimonas propionicica]